MLRNKLGDQEAEAFIQVLENKVESKFDDSKLLLATKEDISKSEARLTMRMFVFWIGQLGALIAIIKFVM